MVCCHLLLPFEVKKFYSYYYLTSVLSTVFYGQTVALLTSELIEELLTNANIMCVECTYLMMLALTFSFHSISLSR